MPVLLGAANGVGVPAVTGGEDIVELTRVQPFEAQVIVAKLGASGIKAWLSADSPYDSVTYADGASVFVSVTDAPRARDVLADTEPRERGTTHG